MENQGNCVAVIRTTMQNPVSAVTEMYILVKKENYAAEQRTTIPNPVCAAMEPYIPPKKEHCAVEHKTTTHLEAYAVMGH